MKVLVTGAGGFVGHHLLAELRSSGHQPVAMLYGSEKEPPETRCVQADIRDADALRSLVEAERPDACVHLAGQAFVPRAWEIPGESIDLNISGTVNVLEAIRHASPQCRAVVVTSSEVYGRAGSGELITENCPLRPTTMYGVTKAAADMATLAYAAHYGLPVMTARPQNHIGPGQSPRFAISSFVAQIAAITKGADRDAVMRVGNLDTQRDFTDVRDVVRAYRLLLEKGTPGQAYNIGSGTNTPLRRVVEELCRLAGVHPMIKVDSTLHRPTDLPPLLDTSRIQEHTGWRPTIPLSNSLRDLLLAAQGG